MKNKFSFKLGVLVLSLVLIACSGGSTEAGCPEIDGREINVVATTPMIGICEPSSWIQYKPYSFNAT